ncbi:hypothetical protein OUHCRE2_49580 [Enterobacter asburiae]
MKFRCRVNNFQKGRMGIGHYMHKIEKVQNNFHWVYVECEPCEFNYCISLVYRVPNIKDYSHHIKRIEILEK